MTTTLVGSAEEVVFLYFDTYGMQMIMLNLSSKRKNCCSVLLAIKCFTENQLDICKNLNKRKNVISCVLPASFIMITTVCMP